jgi:hypothetical protein
MTGPPTIARLSGGGRIWALGALLGDDDAIEGLARAVLSRWQPGDRLVVLGNMLGPNGDPAGTLDGLLRLRRRLMAANRSCGILFLRGAGQRRRSAAVGRRRGCHAAPRRTGRRLFWWSAQSDATLAAALTGGADAGWTAATRLVRGAGPSADAAAGYGQVLTVTRPTGRRRARCRRRRAGANRTLRFDGLHLRQAGEFGGAVDPVEGE